MGVDFAIGHDDAIVHNLHWSYSGFNLFRERLAAEINVPLRRMRGFGNFLSGPPGDLPWDQVRDDIVPLLNHSDCDGELSPEECARAAPRIRTLVASWEEPDFDKDRASALADAMDECVRRNVPLVFC